MSNLDALFKQFRVVNAESDQSNSDQKYVKLDSTDAFAPNRSTRIIDLERSLFAKWSKEEDDDPPTLIDDASISDSDTDEDEICLPCPVRHSVTTTSLDKSSATSKPKRLKSTDKDMKRFAFDMSRMEMTSCNPTVCKNGGDCVQKTTIADMRQMVQDFWGDFEDGAPSSKTRRLLILEILRSAFRPDTGEFEFYAGNKRKNNTRVCEAAYLILLGLSNHPNASTAPGQWTNTKDYVVSGKDKAGVPYSTKKEDLLRKAESKSIKFKSATTFIEFFAKEFGDTIPGPEGGLDVYVAPFVDLKSFHREYLHYHAHQQTRTEDIAKLSTFNSAFKLMSETKGIKLLKAKGSHQTCEICNNASELLANKNRGLKHSQREVIQKFRQLHLTQQSREREYLDHRKLEAAKVDDAGNPLRLFLFSDGFTVYTCNTPRFRKESKGDKVFETRIVGTEVICGPIKTVLVYRTDALVGGGANITIELMRQAMIDTSILLRKRGLLFPRTLWLQFDNCGDNKNQYFFMYSSLLIELFAFDEVEIAFLIVGHTHASIDQYFSVIAKAIRKAEFIGTPIALLELIRRCHDSSWQQKAVIREIKVYYDLKTMFEPYRNKRIKYFGIPHIFRFTPFIGHVAIMEYKNFSRDRFMPPRPSVPIPDIQSLERNTGAESILIPELAAVNGSSALTEFLGLGTASTSSSNISIVAPKSMHDMLGKNDKINLLKDVNSLLDDFESLSIRSIQQQEARLNDEAEGLPVQKIYQYRADLQRKMMNQNSSAEGFIIWLDLVTRKNLAPLNELTPKSFDPADGLDRMDEFLSILDKEDRDDCNLHNQSGGGPPFKRKKPLSSKEEDRDAAIRRQVKAAKYIASTSQWVLNLLKNGRVRRTFGDEFEENHFYDNHLTNVELKWLEDNDSIEKVLSVNCMAYATAPDWEPFPKTTLSGEDLRRIEEEKAKHLKAIDEANAIGRSLLVRIGENAAEGQHVVAFGKGTAEWIGQQLSIKRAAKKTSKATAAPAASSSTTSTLTTAVDENRCAVEECVEKTVIGSCEHEGCSGLRFCDLHLSHVSHDNHRLHRALDNQNEQECNAPVASLKKLKRPRIAKAAMNQANARERTAPAPSMEPVTLLSTATAVHQDASVTTAVSLGLEISTAPGPATAAALQSPSLVLADPPTAITLQAPVEVSAPSQAVGLVMDEAEATYQSSYDQGFSQKFESLCKITLAPGSVQHELHLKIVSMIASEASKQKDFTGRLERELNFSQYINPLAILCIEVYQLRIPQLSTPEVQELNAASGLSSNCDYKKLLFGSRTSKAGLTSFLKSFVNAFVSKYCQ